uniref:Uncharacterized protein n=1 Tax=Ciona savignyi TaxID=51511 RepID=H2ZMG6_CIOSA
SHEYRRGDIEEDGSRKRQEQEILIRRKINRPRKHHKHKHSRHKGRSSSKSPLACGTSALAKHHTAPSFVVQPQVEVKVTPPDEDQGITFTAGNKKEVEVATEETAVSDVKEESVAIDRELPWKRSTTLQDVVSDPHNTSNSAFEEDEPPPSNILENVWPSNPNNKTDNSSNNNTNNNNNDNEDDGLSLEGLHFEVDWQNMSEDHI